ncbi:hypothetical protein QQS21_011768 [Conoideocrella luteorostrata]|uniref:Uncharacterized protein n=1 Tax=Conoideocrella luteorostrata TaxID=1105319 RepID=A0AAJ0FT19_9HYPO|nr:hypothetical protein QQS21_011768 [Conoideocrella luteorostrata]
MMYPTYGGHTPDTLPLSYPQDVYLDESTTQRAMPQAARRLSKGSGVQQQRAGTAMRVSKPNSTSNSPRSSSMASRRRTMIGTDVWTPHRQQQIMDYFSAPPKQTSRPLSWHPSSYLQITQQPAQQQHPQQQTGYVFLTPSLYGTDYNDLYGSQPHFSPMMASYSNDTSPSSAYSPLPLFPASDQAQYAHTDGWDRPQKTEPAYPSNESLGMPEPFPMLNNTAHTKSIAAGGLDWNSFIVQGFNNTTPPTPEAFSQPQQQPAMSGEATVAYEALDEPEEEGEILVGMGLYDTPEKVYEDPQLNNYRSTVSSLWGSSCRPLEPRGKGLKLEETWEPPTKTDDDEDDDEDEEGDDE